MGQIFDFCIFRHFMAFFVAKKKTKIEKTAEFSPKNSHKMPKNTKIKILFHAILDFMPKVIQTKFQVK